MVKLTLKSEYPNLGRAWTRLSAWVLSSGWRAQSGIRAAVSSPGDRIMPYRGKYELAVAAHAGSAV